MMPNYRRYRIQGVPTFFLNQLAGTVLGYVGTAYWCFKWSHKKYVTETAISYRRNVVRSGMRIIWRLWWWLQLKRFFNIWLAILEDNHNKLTGNLTSPEFNNQEVAALMLLLLSNFAHHAVIRSLHTRCRWFALLKPTQGNVSYKPHETVVFYLGTAVN